MYISNARPFAIMRHGVVLGDVLLTPKTIKVIERVMMEFADKVKPTNDHVVIFHSPKGRATLTAHHASSVLTNLGFADVTHQSLDWLDCNKNGITDKNIEALIDAEKSNFVLLIGHEPDIYKYLHKDIITNCSIFSDEFYIQGH